MPNAGILDFLDVPWKDGERDTRAIDGHDQDNADESEVRKIRLMAPGVKSHGIENDVSTDADRRRARYVNIHQFALKLRAQHDLKSMAAK